MLKLFENLRKDYVLHYRLEGFAESINSWGDKKYINPLLNWDLFQLYNFTLNRTLQFPQVLMSSEFYMLDSLLNQISPNPPVLESCYMSCHQWLVPECMSPGASRDAQSELGLWDSCFICQT